MRSTTPLEFGLSTHLFHGEKLEHRHLDRIAAHGFRLVELFATRTHIDYHDPQQVARIRGWLDELGVHAWSLHAPICDQFAGGVWGRPFSNATNDAVRREEALEETRRSIIAARDLGCSTVVVHLGVPHDQPTPADDNDPAAVRRVLEPMAHACVEAGVRLALEVIPNHLATPAKLLEWLDGDLDLGDAAVCLDVGHAHLLGGAPEAAETLSGHVTSTHLHDNRGTRDEHLVPFDGTIDWPSTLVALVKIGYVGPLVLELADHGDAGRTLERAVGARRRIQAILDDLARPLAFTEE
jgi:sugar phosphate isomerase/epimerase